MHLMKNSGLDYVYEQSVICVSEVVSQLIFHKFLFKITGCFAP